MCIIYMYNSVKHDKFDTYKEILFQFGALFREARCPGKIKRKLAVFWCQVRTVLA